VKSKTDVAHKEPDQDELQSNEKNIEEDRPFG
jgi:hypothetical protein